MGNIFCVHPEIEVSACIEFVNNPTLIRGLTDITNAPKLIELPLTPPVSITTYVTTVIATAGEES